MPYTLYMIILVNRDIFVKLELFFFETTNFINQYQSTRSTKGDIQGNKRNKYTRDKHPKRNKNQQQEDNTKRAPLPNRT
jgi:hypothetical protein